MDLERRELFFAGRVQGVGFRYTTYRIAANHQVSGFVENLADGRVHIVVEGLPGEVGAFIQEVSATMKPHIQAVQSDIAVYAGEFDRFEIRR